MEGKQDKCAASSDDGGLNPAVGTVCVFCGSRPGNRPSFSAAALDLGKQMVRRRT
jgi:cytokinin riboside 5'-monophosphate phosphoribohydrolase